jgi:hypothetical protein
MIRNKDEKDKIIVGIDDKFKDPTSPMSRSANGLRTRVLGNEEKIGETMDVRNNTLDIRFYIPPHFRTSSSKQGCFSRGGDFCVQQRPTSSHVGATSMNWTM